MSAVLEGWVVARPGHTFLPEMYLARIMRQTREAIGQPRNDHKGLPVWCLAVNYRRYYQ